MKSLICMGQSKYWSSEFPPGQQYLRMALLPSSLFSFNMRTSSNLAVQNSMNECFLHC